MVDIGDVDGDSRPDIITCSWGTDQNLLLLNRLHTSSNNFVLVNPTSCDPSNASARSRLADAITVPRGIHDSPPRSCPRELIVAEVLRTDRSEPLPDRKPIERLMHEQLG